MATVTLEEKKPEEEAPAGEKEEAKLEVDRKSVV